MNYDKSPCQKGFINHLTFLLGGPDKKCESDLLSSVDDSKRVRSANQSL